MDLTRDEIRVIWLALHNFSPYDPEIACGLSESRQEEICSDIRVKIFAEITHDAPLFRPHQGLQS
jgi:hypothetical protein